MFIFFLLIIISKYNNDISYLPISVLKQTPLPEKQLRIFFIIFTTRTIKRAFIQYKHLQRQEKYVKTGFN